MIRLTSKDCTYGTVISDAGDTRSGAARRGFALTCVLVVGALLLAGLAAGRAEAQGVAGKLHLRKSAAPSLGAHAKGRWVCPEGACNAIIAPTPRLVNGKYWMPGAKHAMAGHGVHGGLDPADLSSAYRIPTSGARGQTVAVIDAYGYEYAELDLAKYRTQYGLPACTHAHGCFRKVNESGEAANYPPGEPQWDGEAALDLDMVSAACPECHILLVEAKTERPSDMAKAAATAAALGATEISNSYGYPELNEYACGRARCAQYNKYYTHPGVMVFASAGDSGFENANNPRGREEVLSTNFPAASPAVVAVGGTLLEHKHVNKGRSWYETVWNEGGFGATGAGCSTERKPAWQTDTGCAGRTDNDVAADAAMESGVSMFLNGAWYVAAGTSVASPLVAGIEAHAPAAVRALGPQALYADPAAFYKVTEGNSFNEVIETEISEHFFEVEYVEGNCPVAEYLCRAVPGYNGPTGLGTPDGAVQ